MKVHITSFFKIKILFISCLLYAVHGYLDTRFKYDGFNATDSSLSALNEVYSRSSKQKRNTLQTPQNMRIVYDFSLIENNSTLTDAEKTLIRDVCETSRLFIQSLLKMNSRKDPISIDPKGDECYDIPFSSKVISPNSVTNADLFIMVTTLYNDTTSMVANAISCWFEQAPIIGRISINSAYVTDKYMQKYGFMFQNVLAHELIHVLGFSLSQIYLWNDPKTQKPFGDWFIISALDEDIINGVDYYLLQTQNVKRLFQRHFSCQKLSGMPLEHDLSNHWTRLSIYNEVMNPYIFNMESDFSQFTTAMLRDTGYYSEINDNYIKFSGWGLNQGCSFIQNTCQDPQIEFEEFNYASNNRTFDCDVNGHGKGKLPKSQTDLESCESFQNSDIGYCTLVNVDPVEYTGEQYSPQSKCIRSSHQKSTISNPFLSEFGNTRCFKTICQNDGTLEITTLSGIKYICQYPGQLIQISNGIDQGFISCPTRFQPYCFFKKFCSKNCSQKGFCVDGVCFCISGHGGEDCSTLIQDSQVFFQGDIVDSCPNGLIKNPNRVCMEKCPLGFYATNGECNECYGKCSQCTGPGQNECTKCNLDYILVNNSCYESDVCPDKMKGCRVCLNNSCYQCSIGYYKDSNNQCQPCSSSCLSCVNKPDFCTSCLNNAFLSENQCVDKKNAMKGCQQLNQNSQQICNVCADPYVLDENGKCQGCPANQFYSLTEKICKNCSTNCLSCQYQEDHCTSCEQGFIYNSKTSKCISYPAESKLANKQKFSCHRTCSKCYDESFTSCTQCKANRFLFQTSQQYKNICLSPDQSTDYLFEVTKYDYLASQVTFVILALHLIAILKQILRIAIYKQRIFKLVVLIYTYQTISYFRFINFYFPLEVDTILRSLQIYNIFNFQVYKADLEIDYNTSLNPKFLMEEKTPYFFANSIILLTLVGFINIVHEIHYFVRFLNQKFYYKSMQLVTTFINFFAIQEFLINLFISISLFEYNSAAQAQLILGFLIFAIVIAITIRNIISIYRNCQVYDFSDLQNKDQVYDENKTSDQNTNKDKKSETKSNNDGKEIQQNFHKKIDDSQYSATPSTEDSRFHKNEDTTQNNKLFKKPLEKVDLRRMVINKQHQNKVQNQADDQTMDSSPVSKNQNNKMFKGSHEDSNFSAQFNKENTDTKNSNEGSPKQNTYEFSKQEANKNNHFQEYQKTEVDSPISKFHEASHSPEQLINQQMNAQNKNIAIDSFNLNQSNTSELSQKQQDMQILDALTDVGTRTRNSSLFKKNQEIHIEFENPIQQGLKHVDSPEQPLNQNINKQQDNKDSNLDSFHLNSTNRSELNQKQLDLQNLNASADIERHRNDSQFKKNMSYYQQDTINEDYSNYPIHKLMLKIFSVYLLEKIVFTTVIVFFYEKNKVQVIIIISLQIFKLIAAFIAKCYLKKIYQFSLGEILENILLTIFQLTVMLALIFFQDQQIASIIGSSVLILTFFSQILIRQIIQITMFIKELIVKMFKFIKS